MLRHAVIRRAWDDDAGVWFVRDSDIPGLATEAPTLEALRGMVQDLLDVDIATDVEIDGIADAHGRGRV